MSRDQSLSSYLFDLPPGLVAQRPAERRDASRLMLLGAGGEVEDHVFADLPDLLRSGDVLIRNNVRVLPARLLGKRPGGGRTELLLVRPDNRNGADAWLCLARPASHLREGKTVSFGDGELTATILGKEGGGAVWAEFSARGEAFRELIGKLGRIPLPPYIERPDRMPTSEDEIRYQTSYAKKEGAVAAPTAGLHFTPELDVKLAERGVEVLELTLNVGPGTFRPIKAENLDDHRMDSEYYEIEPGVWDALSRAGRDGRRRIAVGTTSARALESAALAEAAGRDHLGGWTDLFIRPGFEFRTLDGLVTNFHLPGSSLLVMISALAGRERVLAAYGRAVESGYRFYSYGDAMLIWR